jgi:hypothetical protein
VALVETEDARVVAAAVVDQDAWVVFGFQCAQDLGELGGAELAGSAGAGDPLGQPADPLPVVAHARVRRQR